ncbi:hypothetical protein [Romboutsia lituseburensis]|uniref:hypothetical protein n=1 Tax=Romboutsia lituseburensis TaxID=1537 RepID=UPI00215B50C3|nr:hypothetical protein [Romboutsia lituseburensis]MCR8746287.1 hypothetical protein [Romboutsia lituseburensis]
MSLKTPINRSFNIICPKCEHKYLYDLRLDELKELSLNKTSSDLENQYEFLSYVVCKNPLCNYDMELKGHICEYPENIVKSAEIFSTK